MAIESKDLIPKEDMQKDYDNDGLTNEKELELGTEPFNLDTDGDGVADGTEIDMYKTDPLKYSTAGDDISDGAKINSKLDPLKKVSFFNKLKRQISPTIIDVENSKIQIKTSDLETMSNYIIDESKVSDINDKLLTTPIKIHSVNGKVIIPLDKPTTKTTKVSYYNEFTKSFTDVKSKISDNSVEVDIEKENPLPIVIYNGLSDDIQDDLSSLENDTSEYFIFKLSVKCLKEYDFIGFTDTFPDKVFVMRKNNNIFNKFKPTTNDIKKYFNIDDNIELYYSEANSIFFEEGKNIIISIVDMITKEQQKDLEEMASLFQFMTYSEYTGNFRDIAKMFQGDLDNKKVEVVDNRESLFGKTYHSNTNFDVKKDAPSFSNFSATKGATGGNCAGFSSFVTRKYNNEIIPRKYEYLFKDSKGDTNYNYDLREKAFDSLLNKGTVHDYNLTTKGDSGVYDIDAIAQQGNDKDAQVLTMLGTLWGKANTELGIRNNKNSVFAIVGSRVGVGSVFGSDTDVKKYADILEGRMNNDKVTYLAISRPNAGHAITAIGINTNPVDPNIVDVTVYDNNFADNKWSKKDGTVIDMTNRLKVRLILKEEKKNIFGQTKKLVSQKYIYYTSEEFKDNPSDYSSIYGYNNLNVDTFSLKSYYTAIFDENYMKFN